MSERLLFLTGHLAYPRLERLMRSMGETSFSWQICDIGVKVAALMTEAIITRRLVRPISADRIILPGRCRADLARLSNLLGVPVARGPDELSDLPVYLGRGGQTKDLSGFSIRIFAEIVDASALPIEALLARAAALRKAGADVIDVGCLPDTSFPHLEESVRALKAAQQKVSIDSADRQELTRGARAGADFLLSLDEGTLDIAEGTGATPILVPAPHGDLDSLVRAANDAARRGISFIVDPILDPIHFGFAESLTRYVDTRRRLPGAGMMMGTGNLTELTEADSGGIAAILVGLCSELDIRNVLTVQVSPHTRRTIEEHDAARRLMFAARDDGALPKGYDAGLLALHDLSPYPSSPKEIAEIAAEVRDANFRIATAEDGIHVFNRDGHHISRDAFSLFPKLGVEADGAHAFYLGAELAKAEIAYGLGKRYTQDEPLDWGCAIDTPEEDKDRLREAGHTLRKNV
ncbi:MAG: dihydropteroate synthase [Hyphomicrobiales bacterium]|nr:MAG: dihydropteroate synthase [Hyphomicrobiales bacterium]